MDESILFSAVLLCRALATIADLPERAEIHSVWYVCMCVCTHRAIFTPLWVIEKKQALMKNAEYITLQNKFFSPLTYSYMGTCILWVLCLIKIKYVCRCMCMNVYVSGLMALDLSDSL